MKNAKALIWIGISILLILAAVALFVRPSMEQSHEPGADPENSLSLPEPGDEGDGVEEYPEDGPGDDVDEPAPQGGTANPNET